MNKNHILYTHPVIGNITVQDLMQDINLIIQELSFFQSIIYDMLQDLSYLSNEDISSLLNFIPVEKLNWILNLLNHLMKIELYSIFSLANKPLIP